MSRTIRHQVSRKKEKMPKLEKGTKTTMKARMTREIDDNDDLDLKQVV